MRTRKTSSPLAEPCVTPDSDVAAVPRLAGEDAPIELRTAVDQLEIPGGGRDVGGVIGTHPQVGAAAAVGCDEGQTEAGRDQDPQNFWH